MAYYDRVVITLNSGFKFKKKKNDLKFEDQLSSDDLVSNDNSLIKRNIEEPSKSRQNAIEKNIWRNSCQLKS